MRRHSYSRRRTHCVDRSRWRRGHRSVRPASLGYEPAYVSRQRTSAPTACPPHRRLTTQPSQSAIPATWHCP